MAVNLSPVGGVAAQFFTNTGAVLTGGKLFTYLAGTTTPATAYTSSQGTTAWTNPIVLDAAGRVSGSGEIWLTDGVLYKFVLKDSNDVLIATYDNIAGINSNSVAYTNQQQIVTATAGQTVFNLSISYQPGTNSLSVFVDGVNQYGPGAQYAYTETDSDTVTFVSGLHVGAEVKFTTTQQQGAGAVDASQVSYTPAGTGAVTTNVQAKLRQTVSVMDFRAVGDGVANDTVAVQTALNSGLDIVFPEGEYLITDTVTMGATGQSLDQRNNRNITMLGTVVYNGPQDRAVLEFGAAGEYMSNCTFVIRVRAANAPTWASEDYIGVSLINPNTCQINIELAQQFTVGVRYLGWDQGAYYNTIFHGLIYDNKIGALYSSKGNAAGVCNENYTFGGRYVVDSAVNLGISRYGVVIGSVDGNYVDNNANSFYGFSTEISASNLTGGAVAYGIWIQHGIQNIFRSWRTEAAGTTNSSANVLISNASSGNIFEASYGAVVVNDLSSLPNVDISGPAIAHKLNVRKGWNSGNLGRIATQYNATEIMVPGCDLYSTGDAVAYNYLGGWQIDNKDYIETTSGRGVGISVDTVQQKQFLACVDAVSNFGGRVAVRCYDANGAVLTGSSPTYAKGTSGLTLTYNATTQSYATGGDNNFSIMFTVTSDVKSIDVMFTSGTAALKIKSFGVYAVGLISNDANLTVFNRAAGVSADKTRYGTLIPVLGWYVPTDIVKRYPPASGQPLGWTCTAGSFQTTGTVNSGSNSLTVASAGSAPFALAIGMGITVVGAGAAGANLRTTITNVSGTTITLAANAGTSVTNAQVTTAGSWAALANL
jgi:hypothetical protein